MKTAKIKHYMHKTTQVLKEEGFKSFTTRTKNFVKFNVLTRSKPTYNDILFINGCTFF